MVSGDMGMTALEADYISVFFPSLPSNISILVARVKALGFGTGIHGYRGQHKSVGQRDKALQARPDLFRPIGYNVSIPLWQVRVAISTRQVGFHSSGMSLRVTLSDKPVGYQYGDKVHGTPHNMTGIRPDRGHYKGERSRDMGGQAIRNVTTVYTGK